MTGHQINQFLSEWYITTEIFIFSQLFCTHFLCVIIISNGTSKTLFLCVAVKYDAINIYNVDQYTVLYSQYIWYGPLVIVCHNYGLVPAFVSGGSTSVFIDPKRACDMIDGPITHPITGCKRQLKAFVKYFMKAQLNNKLTINYFKKKTSNLTRDKRLFFFLLLLLNNANMIENFGA